MERQLAVSSGVALREIDGRLHFLELGNASVGTASFVLGVLALIATSNGVLQVIVAGSGRGGLLALGLVLTPLGLFFGWAALACHRYGKRRAQLPSSELRTILILDPVSSWVWDGSGRAVAPIAHTRFATRFRVGSSSRRLVLVTPDTELSLVAGNPFAGGLWAICAALEQHGHTIGR